MEKRVLLTVAISVVIIIGWFWLFPPKPPAQTPAPTPNAPATPGTPPAPGTPPPSTPTANPSAAAPNAPTAERPPEKRTVIERPGLYRAVFSTWGAAPAEFTLLNPRFTADYWVPKPDYLARLPPGTQPTRASDDDPNWKKERQPLNLVDPHAGPLPYQVSFPESDFTLAPDAAYELVSQTDEELVYAADVGKVHVEKRWRLPKDGYQLGLVVSVENRAAKDDAAAKPLVEHLAIDVTGWQDPLVKQGGFSFGRRFNTLGVSCDIAGKLQRKSLEDAAQKPLSEVGDVKWIGVGEQFFVMAAAFAPENGVERRCSLHGDQASGRLVAQASFAERRVAPGSKTEYQMVAFVGPKQLHALDAVNFNGVDAKLGDAVNYTLEWLARPMLWVLKGVQRGVINWGLAIIVFTILLKLVTYYPTAKSMKSMRQMTALKPEMDRIKEKWKDDKNKQNQEVMELYKRHGVNPLGGCLPTAIQMPIYIAFYSMLSNAVELYHASFVGPIDDMTAPYWPLAAVAGVLMFAQQRFSPTSPDGQQQKMMMYMMPVMFTAFTIFLPSGLTLYILTNSVLTMAQQWWFNRSHPIPAPALKPKRA